MTAQPSDQPQSATDESSGTPEAHTPEAHTPKAHTPEAHTPEAHTPEAQTPEAQTSEAQTPVEGAQPEPGSADEAAAAQPAADVPAADPPAADAPSPETPTSEEPTPDAPVADASSPDATAAEPTSDGDAAPEDAAPEDAAPEDAAPEEAATADGGKKGKRKKKGGSAGKGDGQVAASADAAAQAERKKASGPDPAAIVKRIGTTSAAALAYVKDPDPKLARMSRKHREAVITDIPPVTAGALLGPDALCRHFLASAASGRYQDLFFLWELFVAFPDECKPVLAQRQRAQEKARAKLRTATHLGLLGDATRVAADIDRATGLPWRWLREILEPMAPAIRQRPQVLAALQRREPGFTVDLPAEPSDRWLAEAARMRESGADVPAAIDELLGRNADRLPATVATLSMAQSQYPDRVPALIDRVDLQARDIGAIFAWARDHGHAEQLLGRVSEAVTAAAAVDRAAGLAAWKAWQARGVEVPMPESLTTPDLAGLDLGRPESAELIKVLVDGGADLDPQQILDGVAAENRQLGEKAYEAFVSAGFDEVHLPLALEGNPMVRPETRCPACQAWTWVRPGLEKRCPREGCPLRARATAPPPDAGAEVDAAIAALGVDAGVQTPVALPSPAATGPVDVPAPAPRPAAPPPPAALATASPPTTPIAEPDAEPPAEEAPAADAPADDAPAEATPVDAAPADAAPVEQAPVEQAPDGDDATSDEPAAPGAGD
jgi:hypothetical protein